LEIIWTKFLALFLKKCDKKTKKELLQLPAG
jgi:hypothetical protein